MEKNKINVVTYMQNRYNTCTCSKCGKDFLFMLFELVPDETKNELSLMCAGCGFNGTMAFETVKENIKKDGYEIESLLDFINIKMQAIEGK